MTNERRITLEEGLYIFALVAGFAFRLINLGQAPLTDAEAGWSLQALNLARGDATLIGSQPGYVLLTTVLFYIFLGSNFLARLWPVLFGTALILAPFLFRDRLGRLPALVLAFGMAFDPGLLAVSRQAGGLTLALACVALAGGFWLLRRKAGAGIFIGVGLLGGAGLWLGLVPLSLAGLWTWLQERRKPADLPASEPREPWKPWPVVACWAGAALLLIGTLFFIYPAGLGAAAGGVATFVSGWWQPSGVKLLPILVALLAYEPLPLLLGLARLVSNSNTKSRLDVFLSRWWFLALLLVIAYPARQVGDLAWSLLPLWALAARQVENFLLQFTDLHLPAFGQALMTVILGVFGWLNLTAILNIQQAGTQMQLRTAGLVGSLVLALLVAVLIGWGWSVRTAFSGLGLGVGILLVVFSISAAVNSSGLGQNPQAEVWVPGSYVADAHLLESTIGDLASWNSGDRNTLDIIVVDYDLPSMRWVLRNEEKVNFQKYAAAQSNPSLVIAADTDEPAFTSTYRGQDFIWSQSPAWDLLISREWLVWLVDRSLPMEKSQVVLWARQDLFPGVGGVFNNP